MTFSSLQLMGIEVDSQYGGAGSTFFASVLAIEELAKVDASVSVVCDVQNTLINAYFREYASKEMQARYFPRLSTDLVGCDVCMTLSYPLPFCLVGLFLSV